MTPHVATELLRALKIDALDLDQIEDRVRATGSAWSREQIALFLSCVATIARDDAGLYRLDGSDGADALLDALMAAVRSFGGKPVTAAQVRARLPNHFVTTDEQVLALARRTPGLEIFGPGLIRVGR